jgi:type IV pilus assembly protein PilW
VDYNDWRYIVNIYYIRNYANTAGDGIPTLCKKYLTVTTGGTPEPTMNEICLAEGVEHFHVQFGLDTDTKKDGVANIFASNPTAEQVSEQAVSAKIFVLVRAKTEDPTFANQKTYALGDRSVTVDDKYYRRVYSTQVVLRNPLHSTVFTAMSN